VGFDKETNSDKTLAVYFYNLNSPEH